MADTAPDAAIIISFLKSNPLFQDLEEQALAFVAHRLELVKFAKTEPIVLENEPSDHVYFVFTGSVEVVKHLPELKQINRLAVLKPPQHFSDFSVLNREPKSASVFALEDCSLLRITGENFMEVLCHIPAVSAKLARQIALLTSQAHASHQSVDYCRIQDVRIADPIAQLYPIRLWARYQALPIRFEHQSLFLAVKNPQNSELFTYFKQGHPTLQLHLSLIGDNDFNRLQTDLTGAYSGKAGKFAKQEKVIAPEEAFNATSVLSHSPLFKDFPPEYRTQIASLMKEESFAPGAKIYRSGAPSDKLYLILSGQVEIHRPLSSENASVFVGLLGPGAYFSEVSLLTKKPHGLSARAVAPTKVAVISQGIIERLMDSPYFTLPLARAMAHRFQVINNSLSLKIFNPKEGLDPVKLASLLPRNIIDEHQILPLRLKDNELTIGTVTRASETIYPVIGRYLQDYRVALEVIQPSDFNKWLAEVDKVAPKAAEPRRSASTTVAIADAVELFEDIIKTGFSQRASDVYIEPTPENYGVRYRVDGVLREHPKKFSREVGAQIINRIKVLAEMDTTKKFIPQDGQIKFSGDIGKAYARVATMPTKHGENSVMRLIRERSSVPPMASMVPDRRVISVLNNVAHAKQGVFLVTGPTGSGKSTTLYSLIKELNKVEVSIITVEDPVEMEIPGTTQVEINEKVGLTFAAALRNILRQAPDVIMIGEIRDEESAKTAFHAAMTGHLVISTLHTNNSLEIIPRLLELGVPGATLASGLIGASAQRLLRGICTKCRSMRPAREVEQQVFRDVLHMETPPTELPQGTGCAACSGKGYKDRIPVVEIWQKTTALEPLIGKGASWSELYPVVKQQGFDTLLEFGLKMVLAGLTTLEEVSRVLGLTLVETSVKNSTSNAA